MEYKKLTARETAERLLEIERPLIVMHARPDGDTVGCGVALSLIFKALGKSPVYACADELPERFSFITKSAQRAALSDNYFEYDAAAIDVASPAQLGSLSGKIKAALMIDHHAIGEPFTDNYIIPEASSAAEVLLTVAEELIKMDKLEMTADIASALYTAISSDTGGFVFSNTKPETLRRAAYLMEFGIDHAKINHALFYSKSREQILAEGFVASKIKTDENGAVAYAAISMAEREALGVRPEHLETAIDIIRSLSGVRIAFIVKETDGGFRASLRSTGEDVSAIAALFSGGGHIRAAGCTVKAESADDAAKILLDAIKANIDFEDK